jgi:hypothetical protein
MKEHSTVLIAALSIAFASPAFAQEFDPMTPEQKAEALPLQREASACFMRETNKPYRTSDDIQKLIEAAEQTCKPITGRLRATLGTSRMEAWWQDFEPMLIGVHSGAADMVDYYDTP